VKISHKVLGGGLLFLTHTVYAEYAYFIRLSVNIITVTIMRIL